MRGFTRGHAAVVTAVVLWSAGNLIIRGVPMDPAQIAFWRVLLAAGLYWVALRARGRRLTWTDLRVSAPAGVAIGIELWLFFTALKTTSIANATVIGALQPLIVIAFGVRRFGERVTAWLVGSAMVAMVGIALVVFGGGKEVSLVLEGDLLAFLAVFFFAAYFIFAKQARQTVGSHEFQTSIWIVGSVVLLPFALVVGDGLDAPNPNQLLWLGALLAVPTTGHLLMNWAHGEVHLSFASLATLLAPVLSSLGAAALFNETLGYLQVLGIAIVLSTLTYVIRRDMKTVTPAPRLGSGKLDATN